MSVWIDRRPPVACGFAVAEPNNGKKLSSRRSRLGGAAAMCVVDQLLRRHGVDRGFRFEQLLQPLTLALAGDGEVCLLSRHVSSCEQHCCVRPLPPVCAITLSAALGARVPAGPRIPIKFSDFVTSYVRSIVTGVDSESPEPAT